MININDNFNISEYMGNGIENIIKGVVKASFKNPKETAFVLKYALWSKEAKRKRDKNQLELENVPAFLISSITSSCNLFCKGCYARANNSCGEGVQKKQLSCKGNFVWCFGYGDN